MSAEATQGTGADVVDLETMFADEPGDGNSAAAQSQNSADTQQQQLDVQQLVDENGNVIDATQQNVDPDLELELDVDPNVDPNQQQPQGDLTVPDDHKVKLTVNGKEVELSFGDLKASAQKYEGANQKFEEAAAIRKEYTEKAQTLTMREQQLGNVLEYYIGQSQALMQAQQPDWAKLLAENPQEYLVQRHNWEQKELQLQQARQVQVNLQRQQAEQHTALAQQRAVEERGKLVAAIPEWADPMKAAEGAQAIGRYLADQGIPPEMQSQIDTAAVLMVARKAMLYDQAIAKQKAARLAGGAAQQRQQAASQAQQSQQQARQPVGRVERPGAATAAQSAASRQNLSKANAAKAFNANPSVDTLAGFFE